MRFRVYSTCCDSEQTIDRLLERYSCLNNLYPKKEVIERNWWQVTKKETVLTIEVESLAQLIQFATDVKHELVIGSTDEYKIPYIEIYDGYRE